MKGKECHTLQHADHHSHITRLSRKSIVSFVHEGRTNAYTSFNQGRPLLPEMTHYKAARYQQRDATNATEHGPQIKSVQSADIVFLISKVRLPTMASADSLPNVHVSTHPCVKAKLSQLRSHTTNARETKALVHEITLMIGTEALASCLTTVETGTVSLAHNPHLPSLQHPWPPTYFHLPCCHTSLPSPALTPNPSIRTG